MMLHFFAINRNLFLSKLSAVDSRIQLAIAPIAAAVLIKEGMRLLLTPLATDAYQGISRSCVDQHLRALDPGVADFFSLCVNSQGETLQAIEARKQLVQFDALRISEPYRGEILDLQANVANSFFDKQNDLTLAPSEQLGMVLDPFLRTHLDHDTYLAAQNLLDDASSRLIIDYHQTSRMGKVPHGARIALMKTQLAAQRMRQRPLAELQANAQLQALSSCMQAVADGNMQKARAYAQQAGAVGEKYFQQVHDAWKREHCNEYGVKKAYEVDRDWQHLSTEEKEFVKTNELQREKLCAHLEQRDQVRQQLYDQYGLRRDHVPREVSDAIEDLVESQCVLVTNIASGVDTFVGKADQSSAVDEAFFTRFGILKDFARDPVINHFDLDQSDLKLHPELRRATNYCLAIRSSNAPPEAKQLATNVLNTISDQLQGKQLSADTAQAMHELLHNYPAILQQEAYPKPPDEFKLKELAANCAATQSAQAVINEVKKEGALVARQTYEVNSESRALLTRNKISIPQYCVLTGDQLQRQAHGQIVDHLNTLGLLDAKPLYRKTIEMHNDVAKLTQVGVEQVRHGNIAEAWGIAHICKQAITYVKAVGAGVQQGLGNAATHIKDHPAAFALTAAAQVVASKAFLTFQAVSIAADLGGMAYGQLKQVDYKNLTVTGVVQGLKTVSNECRKQAAWLLTPDGIKKATATATNLYAQYRATKLLGSIYQRVFQHTQDALSKLRECLEEKNAVVTRKDSANSLSSQQIVSPIKKSSTEITLKTEIGNQREESALLIGANSKLSLEQAKIIWNQSDGLKELHNRVLALEKQMPTKKIHDSIKVNCSVEQILALDNEAAELYTKFRTMVDDTQLIAKNIGVSKHIIQKIKNHIFFEKHILSHRLSRFDPDINMAFAWKRLIAGNYTNTDLKLLLHEYAEALIMEGDRVDWRSGHDLTNQLYNWEDLLR